MYLKNISGPSKDDTTAHRPFHRSLSAFYISHTPSSILSHSTTFFLPLPRCHVLLLPSLTPFAPTSPFFPSPLPNLPSHRPSSSQRVPLLRNSSLLPFPAFSTSLPQSPLSQPPSPSPPAPLRMLFLPSYTSQVHSLLSPMIFFPLLHPTTSAFFSPLYPFFSSTSLITQLFFRFQTTSTPSLPPPNLILLPSSSPTPKPPTLLLPT